MKYHFADFLDREGDYWTIVPNRERYAFTIANMPQDLEKIEILTLSKEDTNWEQLCVLPNLKELTLDNPCKEQIASINKLVELKRLRITHCHVKNLDFLQDLINVEELVLEYVSGFTDLSPLKNLKKLKSVHFENLRKVTDFKGLEGIESLRFLYINGTLDWKQPIVDFNFLSKLPNLEVLSLVWVINKTPYPAFKPVLSLKKLKKIGLVRNMFAVEEYAFLETALPNVAGAVWPAVEKVVNGYIAVKKLPKGDFRSKLDTKTLKEKHPEVKIINGNRLINDPNPGWFEFLGKGAGKIKCNNALAEEKCKSFNNFYQELKRKAGLSKLN